MRADTHRGPERNRSTSEAEYIDAALTFALSDLHLAPHGRAIHHGTTRKCSRMRGMGKPTQRKISDSAEFDAMRPSGLPQAYPPTGPAVSACSWYWGRSLVIVNHSALELTKMCLVGRMVGSSMEGSQGHVDESSIAHDGTEERATAIAAHVAAAFVAEGQEIIAALGWAQLASLNAGEGLEGRARRPPALRTMAVGGVEKFVGDHILYGATQAFSGERTAGWFLGTCHGLLLAVACDLPR
jgi:hypothetical protein